jgi:uncharacterized membrane protein
VWIRVRVVLPALVAVPPVSTAVLTGLGHPRRNLTDLTATTTVRRPLPEVYAFWRLLENLPTFMEHLDEVRKTGELTSTRVASAPFDGTVEWEAW